jgi:hypothetical protein
MPNEAQKIGRNREAALFGILQLAVLVGLLLMVLQPEFKGGIMIAVILAGTVLLQIAALFGDLRIVGRPESQPHAPSAPDNETTPFDGLLFMRILLLVVTMLSVCYLMGVYVGFVIFLFSYWWRMARFSLRFSLVLALLVGLALPIVFGSLVTVTMWPGTMLELIPGYLGGAVSPPW